MADETLRRSQNSFSGGEIGSKVLGRVDLAKFNTGLRYAKNVFVEIEGAVSNRAGTEHGGRTLTDTGVIRFFPFEAPLDVTYVMEITEEKFRFYFDNALVLDGSSLPVEVDTPYQADELYDLVFAQSNDIMTITHINHRPKELRRTAFNVFNLVDITTNPNITAPTPSISADAGAGVGEITQSYKVAAIDANGVESLASAKVDWNNDLTNSGDKNVIQWNEVVGADSYVVYKRRAGTYGFMGLVRAEDNVSGTAPTRVYEAIDNNINPNTSQTPKRAEDPFAGTDYPAIVFFFGQRRCFASTVLRPNSLINSQVGTFDGFRRSVPALPDDYFELALGSARTQRIRHVVSLDDLLIFTSNQEWRLNASGGFAATQPPDLRPQSSIGVSGIRPLVVGTDVFYVPTSRRAVNRMNYSFDFNKFMSDDISVLSKHLFKKRSMIDWCYAQEPNFLTFGFFDDGRAVLFAYNREQQVYAWTRFETDGLVEACTSIRENGLDRIYLAVRRQIGGNTRRFFERMALRDINDISEGFFVDCGVSEGTPAGVLDIDGGVVYTDGTLGFSSGDAIRIYGVDGGKPDDPLFNINSRFKVAAINSTDFTLVDYLTDAPVNIDTFDYVFGGEVRLMSDTVSGLGHLEGEGVSVLADGFAFENLVVTSGQVTLPIEAGLRTAGLPYESEIHTLELEREDEPTRGRKKSVAFLVMRVQDTRGISAGALPRSVREIREREYENYPDPVNPGSKIVRVALGDGWTDEVMLIIKQTKPLPMTILSVIPEYTFGV